MRRGYLLGKRDSPYPTRNTKPDRDDRRLFTDEHDAPPTVSAPPYTVKELREWGKGNIRLSDDPSMSAKVNLHDLGLFQRLVFRNIRVGTVQVSVLLDSAVLSLLPTRFSSPPTPLENAIEFRSAGANGMGVFATRDIRPAALIHVEHPTTVTQNTLVLNFGMTRVEVYRELFQRVPEQTLPSLLDLCNSQPDEMAIEEAILRSNAIAIKLPSPAVPGSLAMGHNAIFLRTSRLNHSCSPNAFHRFDPQTFALTVHTICPIAKGEEIVHSYIDLTSATTREARRSLLRDLCHFECTCNRCALSDPAAVLQSDERRQKIHDMTRETVLAPLEAWYRGHGRADLKTVIAFHLAAVEEMRIEGLYHYQYQLHISQLAVCYAAIEDIRSFRLWMGRARDIAVRNLAADEAADMLRFIVYPETFSAWGWARKNTSTVSPPPTETSTTCLVPRMINSKA
ncbi:hypothetical protein GGX14DRAFT_495004 [Mycena pura]|uniref:SET domain-containing protein n=1 Tax=Mycena pura TaxID=153505 RepID=A0AAD6VV86_9AGAR|nr:hypothetical protein GGX14DRAFT_495004 [Mycena pura]